MTPLQTIIHFPYTAHGRYLVKVSKCCYSDDQVTQECQNSIRDLFFKCTCSIGALLFPAIEEDFIVIEYLQSEIKVSLNLGSAFPSFIGSENAQFVIDKIMPLLATVESLVNEIFRNHIKFYEQIVADHSFEVVILEDSKNTDWVGHVGKVIKAVLEASKEEAEKDDAEPQFKAFYELLKLIDSVWDKFDSLV